MSKIVKKIKEVGSYSESLKLDVLSYRRKGGVSLMNASRFYGIPESTIRSWEKSSEVSPSSQKRGLYMNDEDPKIRELESALSDAHLKIKLYEKMLELAQEDYGIEVKKNSVTGQYGLIKKNTGSKGPVKR